MQSYIPKIISGVITLALLVVGAWLIVAGHATEGGGLLAAAVSFAGAMGTALAPRLAEPKAADPVADKRAARLRDAAPPSDSALALVLCVVAATCSIAASGCSAGPQLPVTTVPMSISCSWTINTGQGEQQEAATVDSAHGTGAQASAVIADSDCLVDRSSAEAAAATTGNDNRGARVDAELPVHVSATGGGS